MAVKGATSFHTSNHTLTVGGFKKLPLIAENDNKQKVRLYYLEASDDKVIAAAKAALEKKKTEGWAHTTNTSEPFEKVIQQSPYLLKEGKTLRLLSTKDAIELQLKYGVIGTKAENESNDILTILEQKGIKTDEQLVTFYNTSSSDIQARLLPLINTMLCTFEEKKVLTIDKIKTLTTLGQCRHEGIERATLNLLADLFEQSSFLNKDYGFGLKYLLDKMSPEFFKKNQLFLLNIFDKLSSQLDTLLETNKNVNHEIEPLTASLNSAARALLNSDLEKLNKATKNSFYERLKTFYNHEHYSKRMESLSTRANYLLTHYSLWTVQHLIRITSSEHKAVTTLRKIGEGLLTLKTVAGAPLKAVVKLIQEGELPDETVISELKEAYEHGKKAFGIKDIPRPWYEVLEKTESVLLDPQLTKEQLEQLYQAIGQYDAIYQDFNIRIVNQLKKQIGKDHVTEETKEFAFGFVGQFSHVAMDHPNAEVRHKAIEILGNLFEKEGQSHDVHIFILTTLQNIIERKDLNTAKQAETLQHRFHQAKPKLKQASIFRQSKYPCLALIPGSSQLLDEAKNKLQAVSTGTQPLPMSKFIYGSRDRKIFEQLVTVGGNFAPKGPDSITPEELQRVIQAAEKLHIVAFDQNGGSVTIITKIGNKKETIFKGEVHITGDFTG